MVQPGVPVTAGAIDLSATYQSVVDEVLAHATLAAASFHVITHATATVVFLLSAEASTTSMIRQNLAVLEVIS